MSSETEERERSQPEGGPERDPRVRAARAIAGGDEGLEMVAHAAQGATLDEREEIKALDYLLGAKSPARWEVPVNYETPDGMADLVFVVRSMDPRKLDKIETRHLDETNGTIDRLSADCEIVAEATIEIRDASGRAVRPSSEEFRTVRRPDGEEHTHASAALALEERFREQLGLMSGVVIEIKRAAGFAPDRVKKAKRMLQGAALG